MENEERMRRNMEFIVEQQAKSAEWQARYEQKHAETEETVGRLADAMLKLTNIVADHEERHGEHDLGHKGYQERQAKTDEQIATLSVKLDALIDAVTRSVAGGRERVEDKH